MRPFILSFEGDFEGLTLLLITCEGVTNASTPIRETKSFSFAKCSTCLMALSLKRFRGEDKWFAALRKEIRKGKDDERSKREPSRREDCRLT